jgi:hypothetical protein
MRLKPLQQFEIYVLVQEGQEASWKTYKQSPTFYNQHAISSIFMPINASGEVLVTWAHGGFNVVKRSEVQIFHIESLALSPAFE